MTNFAQILSNIGQSALNIGMMSAMFGRSRGSHGCCHGGGSVFHGYMNSGCGGYVGAQFTFGGIGISRHLMNRPLDIVNYYQDPYQSSYQNYYQTPCNNPYGMLNLYNQNNYLNPYSYPVMQQFSPYGYMQQQQQQTPIVNDAPHADLDTNQDGTKGAELSAALDNLNNSTNKEHTIVTFADTKNPTETEYKEQVSELGKSYVANIDKTSGNGDNFVTAEEFTAFEMKSLSADANETQKTQVRQMAQNAFNRLDLNKDGKLDWKEAAAYIRTMDRDNNGSLDGKITSESSQNSSALLSSPNQNNFEKLMLSDYKTLFGDGK